LKKQKAKESKKGTSKKKADKTSDETAAADPSTEDAAPAEDTETATADDAAEQGEVTADTQEPSESQQSQERSKSFKTGDSGASSTSASAEVQELYRKQAARIEELEKENKEYKSSQEDVAARLAKTEEELERLRESTSDVAELRSKAKEAEKTSTELASVQRQLSQAQQAAKGKERRQSGPSPEVSEQLAKTTSTIESQELEMSNLRNQVNSLTSTITERETTVKELEQRATAAEHQVDATKQELDSLKVSMTFGNEESDSKTTDDPETLNKRVAVLESDLRTAHANLEVASERALSLEQKIEALTKLHRDASAAVQAKDKELRDVRAELKRRDRPSHVRDASEFSLQDEETETGQLQSRLRALEAENFDLKRGVWRERRAELQPGMDEHEAGHEYEDVDLNAPASPSLARHTSSFQDVISSGISAFTGRPRGVASPSADQTKGNRPRNQSMGLLSDDDDGFDEEAFRLAQEEDAKRRIERVKEVKRGLEQWKGWRLDLVDVRAGGIGAGRECGPAFEI
jgi:chromosome segregation ATPase